MAKSGEWIIEITEAEAQTLCDAVSRTDGRDALDLSADDFPLAAAAAKIAEFRHQAVDGRGVALLRTGLAGLTEEEARRLIWGIGQHMGIPQKQDGRGTLLHDVRDTGADYTKQHDIRVYQTKSEQPFHNDGADLFCLYCRRQASFGGRSMIVSAHTVFNEILDRRPDLARVLTEPFYFDARGQQLPGRPWYQTLPIYLQHQGNWFVMHKRHYIDLAQRNDEIPRLTAAQTEALDLMDAICHDPAFNMTFEMQPGDLVLGSNHTLLHARTAFDDPKEGQDLSRERRHMLRLWLGVDGGVALPPAYRETREFGYLFETTNRAT
ncbi:MAG: TauD/TfdA family dioxygenase [Rhodospirillaceae bacterium]